MADTETQKEKVSHETAIALIRKDIEYVRTDITEIRNIFASMDRTYAKRDEFNSFIELVKTIAMKLESKADHEDIKNIIKALESKVDVKEFRPMNDALKKLTMIVISAVVVGLISLVIKN